MVNLKWRTDKSQWKGECPRCGVASFFSISTQGTYLDGSRVDVVECPEGHPFSIGTITSSERNSVLYALPVSGAINVPDWLPLEYLNAYSEMMFDFKSSKYRSAVAVAGIMLDCHINTLLRNPGDRKKTLAHRMEILSTRKFIDQDHFADGTIARLSRNEIIHPDDLAREITEDEAAEAINAVSECLERFYKFRRAKALPAGKEQVGDESEIIAEDGEAATEQSGEVA